MGICTGVMFFLIGDVATGFVGVFLPVGDIEERLIFTEVFFFIGNFGSGFTGVFFLIGDLATGFVGVFLPVGDVAVELIFTEVFVLIGNFGTGFTGVFFLIGDLATGFVGVFLPVGDVEVEPILTEVFILIGNFGTGFTGVLFLVGDTTAALLLTGVFFPTFGVKFMLAFEGVSFPSGHLASEWVLCLITGDLGTEEIILGFAVGQGVFHFGVHFAGVDLGTAGVYLRDIFL